MLNKRTRTIPFFLFIIFSFASCNFQAKNEIPTAGQEKKLPPLDSGVFYCQKNDSLIHLRGEQVVPDTLASIINGLFLRDSLLITFSSEWDFQVHKPLQKFTHYSLPKMQPLKRVEEYLSYHSVISTVDSTLLYYLWKPKNKYEQQQLFKYDSTGKITEVSIMTLPIDIGDVINSRISSIYHIGNTDIIYHKDSLITHTSFTKDTVLTKEKLYNLPMNPSWGELIINPSKNRMVYVYRYFHLFHIMDLDAKTVKTIDFNNGNHHYQFRESCMDCIDPNTIYYCAAFAGNEYFYLLYWGHPYTAFYEHSKGWKWSKKEKSYVKTEKYQQNIPNIVEQYDWNGNPISRYLLEGNPSTSNNYFVVNEKGQQFYLLSIDSQSSMIGGYFFKKSLNVYSFDKNVEE